MERIRLSVSHFDVGPVALTNDGWISNGHWAIHPRMVINAEQFATDELAEAFIGTKVRRPKIGADHLLKLFPPTTVYRETRWRTGRSSGLTGILFLSEAGDGVVLNDLYLDAFEALWCDGPGFHGSGHDRLVILKDHDGLPVFTLMPIDVKPKAGELARLREFEAILKSDVANAIQLT